MFGNLRGAEWLIIVLLIVLLFGAKRLPDAARGLGRSLRIFKAETKALTSDGSTDAAAAPAPAAPAAAEAPAATDTAAPAPAPAPAPTAEPTATDRADG